MAGPGTTALSLGFVPTQDGQLHAHGGMGAELIFYWGGDYDSFLGEGAVYDIYTSFAEIGPSKEVYAESEEELLTATGLGLDPFASLSADFALTATNNFTPKSLDGTIKANLQGTTIWRNFPFSIEGETNTLEINLHQPGTWNFNFPHFDLLNDYQVGGKAAWTGNLNLFGYPPIELARYDLGSFPITPVQQLPFSDETWRPRMFSITVGEEQSAIPEPTSLFLLSSGLGAMSFAVWRKRK